MGIRRAALYVRVSTDAQNLSGQEAELRELASRRGWEATVYADVISGSKDCRPALTRLIRDCRGGKFNTVAVWRIDRLGRSVQQVLRELETFRTLGIELVSLSESIDTSTAAGKMVFTIIAAVAEMERSLIVERVRMGIANAKRKGIQFGRPAKKRLQPEEIAMMKSDRAGGATVRELAQKYGCSAWTAHHVTKEARSSI